MAWGYCFVSILEKKNCQAILFREEQGSSQGSWYKDVLIKSNLVSKARPRATMLLLASEESKNSYWDIYVFNPIFRLNKRLWLCSIASSSIAPP